MTTPAQQIGDVITMSRNPNTRNVVVEFLQLSMHTFEQILHESILSFHGIQSVHHIGIIADRNDMGIPILLALDKLCNSLKLAASNVLAKLLASSSMV